MRSNQLGKSLLLTLLQGEVMAFMHTGFWQTHGYACVHKNQLEHLWNSGSALGKSGIKMTLP